MNEVKTKTFDKPFITESGFTLKKPQIAYHTWGELNEAKDNVVLICHALTGNSNAEDWFGGLIGPGKALDPNKYFIVCPNILGSCYGSTGPDSVDPASGKKYRSDFPDITIRDIVRYNQLLLDELNIKGVEFVIGGSLGGMTALEFSIMDERIRSAVLIAMGKSHSPWAIGISQAQRMAIYADQYWQEGQYTDEHPPRNGLMAARAMAMITYRTPDNYTYKFGRNTQSESDEFQVESYLRYQGEKLVSRFDANSYVCLTKAMDTHDIGRGRGDASKVLSQISIPVLVLGFNSDRLYPLDEQKELASHIPNSTFAALDSPYGHDAFLIEFEQLNRHLRSFISSNNS